MDKLNSEFEYRLFWLRLLQFETLSKVSAKDQGAEESLWVSFFSQELSSLVVVVVRVNLFMR